MPLKLTGMNIGFFDGIEYIDKSVNMDNGDTLLVYTDGLFSSGKSSDFSSWPEVESFSRENVDLLEENPHDFLENIFWHFLSKHKENDSDYTDDVAIMLIKSK